jgi:hypothetical protein
MIGNGIRLQKPNLPNLIIDKAAPYNATQLPKAQETDVGIKQ